MKILVALLLTTGIAVAETKVTVQPKTAHPGDAVLVTVTGATETPKGDAGGQKLQFFRARGGYQAVFAVPLTQDDPISVEIDSAKKPARVTIAAKTFPESKVAVEEAYANPPSGDRTTIEADNKAILTALAKGDGQAQFTTGFRRPAGATTSPFGEWRTFNEGHKSQHLGIDVVAKEGSPVKAINAGTVAHVGQGFLAGNLIVIAHGGGISSAYFHLSEMSVAAGDTVEAGAVIGKAGKTGRATGPHLHLSVRVPGGFVNPASFFKLPIKPAPARAASR
ncbi:MAG TPA: M23 family metallopeptidase [Kofleriaceae bacterium]|nr:M23 family metallopeptidase [Kofleriaceae bacterium]